VRIPPSVLALASAAALSLASPMPAPVSSAQETGRPAGWSEGTHGGGARPDYDLLFATDRVHEVHVRIAPDDFQAMQEDLATLGPGGGRGRGAPFPFVPAARGRAAPRLIVRDPIYVPVTVTHDGRTWAGVGMRYKGNSSLRSAVTRGNGKVPFRLDFDRYGDEVPEARNQRFYGFGKLTFSSNFSDDSMLKEVLATEVFRDRGVPAARAAFYRVFIDTGDGDEYWGLYTMVEDPADGAMLDAQFGGREGNLYKPEGPGADWTFFDEAGFTKKTHEREADFSDVQAALVALHAPGDDAAAWRAAIEATFDVDGFLRWLAVNTAIENWDTYGSIAHNYYLYGDPAAGGRLHWIPWDHNMAFGRPFGRFGRGGPAGRGPFGSGTGGVLHEQAGSTWPLIARLLADDVYGARYRELLAESLEGLLAPAAFEARARELHELVAPYVVGEQGERRPRTTLSVPVAFERSLDGPDGLLPGVERRRAEIRDALGLP